jgi:predicted HAD superfamily Cof-like phosphohydrolase
MYPRFALDIQEMNQRYELARVDVSNWPAVTKRLEQFREILDKEFTELGDIEDLANTADDTTWGQPGEQGRLPVNVVVNLADLLGDIIVYCASEAHRWGIPLPAVLMIIMASNTSKSGADGRPIKNPVTDKFEKGPNYWKPEPAIEYIMTHEDTHMLQFHRDPTSGVITYQILEPQELPLSASNDAAKEEPEGRIKTEHPPGVMALKEERSKATEQPQSQEGENDAQQP